MGYDFRIVRKVEHVPAEHKAQGADPSCHRFNNQTMELWRVAMNEWCEATYVAPRPELPRFPPPGLDDPERARAVITWLGGGSEPAPAPTRGEIDACKAYLAAYEAVVARPAIEDGRIASYKFESNAGWLITPDECRILADKIDANATDLVCGFFDDAGWDRSDALDMVEAWVAFQRIAADHGGYRVR